MNKTKIEYCDYTFNPVSGCLHGCEYCYARVQAHRFAGASETHSNDMVGVECQWCTEATGEIHDLYEPIYDVDRGQNAPYPFDFDPTFHRYRLNQPQKLKKPSTIFVVSMGDLFGDWVPDEWIEEVFKACEKAPQHTYMFLTKNPKRYGELHDKGLLPANDNFWYGSTITTENGSIWGSSKYNAFLSIEPILGYFSYVEGDRTLKDIVRWAIIGAETGKRKDKVVPQKEWIENIVRQCNDNGIPVFMKDSLIPIIGEENMLYDVI